MFRNHVCAILVLVACIGFASAEEFSAFIKKVDGDKVTFFKIGGKTLGEKAPDITLPVADNVKVNQGKYDFKEKKTTVGAAIEGGLKNEVFSKFEDKRGVMVRITTSEDGKAITNVVVVFAKKKADDKKDK